MDESTEIRPTSAIHHPAGPGPGQVLRTAREAKGLSQTEVATDLHLPHRVIDALERDDYAALPETATYLRGYIRSYAKHLGLDAAPLLESAEHLLGPASEWAPAVPAAAIEPGFRGMHWVSGGVAALLVVLLATWWMGNGVEQPVREIVAEAPDGDLRLADEVSDARPVAVAPADQPAAAPRDETPAGPVQSATAAPVGQPPPAAASSQAPEPVSVASLPEDALPVSGEHNDGRDAAGEDRLHLGFSAASWVEVYDANGEQLLYGLFSEGAERNLRGTAPFRIMLGYAPGVEVSINGEYYDHQTHVRRNNTARFDLARPSDDL
jgi:cytoskeleton protein RodZ